MKFSWLSKYENIINFFLQKYFTNYSATDLYKIITTPVHERYSLISGPYRQE